MGHYDLPWLVQNAATAVVATALLSILIASYLYLRGSNQVPDTDNPSTQPGDHPILKNHSSHKAFKTPFANYGSIRTFYRPHAHKEKLAAIADLPLLVFVHGLGGSLAQYGPLLNSLVNIAPCFGIDLPGHGLSRFSPETPDGYSTSALKVLWRTAIQDICEQHGHKKVVLIGHSYGCSIAALLAVDSRFTVEVAGIIAICPKAAPPTQPETLKYKVFLSLPDSWLSAFRWWDKRGGVNSTSVNRFVGEGAGIDLRRLQLRYNAAFKTPVWKRTAMGALPEYDARGHAIGGIPGQEAWSKIRVPLFLVAGEADKVTKPSELAEIVSFLHKPGKSLPGFTKSDPVPTAATTPPPPSDETTGLAPNLTTTRTLSSSVLKTATLPFPAAHALLYDHRTYRTVAGLIEDFLSSHVSPHLSLGWQLQQLTTTGKWDVKNLEKWQRTPAVSGPIANNLLRGLKTLREQDTEHTPSKFVAKWKDTIYAVIDISHDAPVYSTRTLEEGGIQYHKFPTVSKIPPTPTEVADFIALVDRLRAEMEAKDNTEAKKAVAVHCHYGFNRTGFFICSYLIERRGYGVQEALDAFREAKPPGIRHDHFVDALWVRHTVGLKRAPTLKLDDSEG
ncbi:uncharacterized protein HMPREF1541_01779 [Cyphellophora europaea CBS 101466]|uniref:Tyrosine specific protein phosphatases domain-containing protein n=1 Tax=Cyphellophora europaea (strain CBS 101466) TaxID=1220924 RepID=W2S1Q9_CYPE1|nr:uncharacterized protein HMPREF1541_01779 [Cyphellophora europaea CBS 101466]ETN42622.1 hypothetical protein HMPREF1541_01779 [Cyphellophora europaea CBS 101466]